VNAPERLRTRAISARAGRLVPAGYLIRQPLEVVNMESYSLQLQGADACIHAIRAANNLCPFVVAAESRPEAVLPAHKSGMR
jgi:hypothetical protein